MRVSRILPRKNSIKKLNNLDKINTNIKFVEI